MTQRNIELIDTHNHVNRIIIASSNLRKLCFEISREEEEKENLRTLQRGLEAQVEVLKYCVKLIDNVLSKPNP